MIKTSYFNYDSIYIKKQLNKVVVISDTRYLLLGVFLLLVLFHFLLDQYRLLLSLGASFFAIYYVLYVDDVVIYHHGLSESEEGKRMKRLLNQCPKLRKKYWPTFYATNKHIQTIMTEMRPHPTHLKAERKYVHTVDGGIIGVDILEDEDNRERDIPTVILLHGVAGGSHSNYVRSMAAVLLKEGYRAVAVNYRGCHDTPLKTPKVYCLASSHDIKECIDFIHKLYPKSTLFGIGFSAGSNILTKYLGEAGDSTPLKGSIGFSTPFDLQVVSENSDSPILKYTYNRIFTASQLDYIKRHLDTLKKAGKLDLERLLECKTMRELDDHLTIKIFDYKTKEEYYSEASCKNFIRFIKRPHLLCHSVDDPIIPSRCISIAKEETLKNENVVLAVTKCGGHLGWFEGIFPFEKTWAEQVAIE